jgi:hypothetical protein
LHLLETRLWRPRCSYVELAEHLSGLCNKGLQIELRRHEPHQHEPRTRKWSTPHLSRPTHLREISPCRLAGLSCRDLAQMNLHGPVHCKVRPRLWQQSTHAHEYTLNTALTRMRCAHKNRTRCELDFMLHQVAIVCECRLGRQPASNIQETIDLVNRSGLHGELVTP